MQHLGPEPSPERRKRALLTLFLTILLSLIGFGIMIPLLPFYGKHMGATPWEIGWLFASYSLAQLIAAPILGELSDRYGRRPVIIGSLVGTAISFVIMALAQDLTTLFVARILDGLSGGNISTARAYIADLTEEKDRAKSFALIGIAFGLGFILGPAMAGLLARIDLSAPAWFAASLAVAATAMAVLWLPETTHCTLARRPSLLVCIPIVFAQPALAFLMALDFLVLSSLSVYQTTFPLFAEMRFGWDASDVGLVLAGVGVLGVLAQGGLVGPLVKRWGERNVLTLGLALTAGGLGAASLAFKPHLFLAGLSAGVVGSGLVSTTLVTLVSLAASSDDQGRVQGVATAMEGLGRATGPVWGNGLLEHYHEGVPYLSAAGVLAFTALLSLGLKTPRPRD